MVLIAGAGVGCGVYPAAYSAGAGAPSWSPSELASLVFGDVASATIDGGRVASCGGLAQPVGSLRPVLIESDAAFAGAPAAAFSGVEWLSVASLAAPVGGWSLWCVARFAATGTVRTVLDTGVGPSVPFAILGLNASSLVLYGAYGYGTAAAFGTDAGAHLLCVTLRNGSAPNLELWVDGVRLVLGSSTYGAPFAAYGLQLGRDHTPWPWAMRGAVTAFGLTAAPMSDAEQIALAEWARTTRGTP